MRSYQKLNMTQPFKGFGLEFGMTGWMEGTRGGTKNNCNRGLGKGGGYLGSRVYGMRRHE